MKGKKPKELAEFLQMNVLTMYRLIPRWNLTEEPDIVLVYLPSYSPYPNLVEFVWRDCKRDLSVYVFEDRMRLFLDVFRGRSCGGAYIGFVDAYVIHVRALSCVLPVD